MMVMIVAGLNNNNHSLSKESFPLFSGETPFHAESEKKLLVQIISHLMRNGQGFSLPNLLFLTNTDWLPTELVFPAPKRLFFLCMSADFSR